MHTLLVLLRKDFTNFFNNRAAVSLTFLVPFALIYIFGQVFGVTNSDRGPAGIPLAVVNASKDPAAAKLVEALKAEKTFAVTTEFTAPNQPARPLTEADLRPMMHNNTFRFAVVIPEDLVSTDTVGLHLKIYSNPRNEIETQMVNGVLQKTIFSNVPQLLVQSLQARAKTSVGAEPARAFNRRLAENIASTFGGSADEISKRIEQGDFGIATLGNSAGGNSAANSSNDLFARIIRIDNEQVVGKDVKSPAATHIVGGFAIQFLLFALSSSAAALFYERDRGIFQRILAGPVSRTQILWSKFLYGAILGLLQLSVLFAGGRILYGIDVEHHLLFLSIVALFAAAACTSFGMLIASIASTLEAASGLATFVILLMCAVGGAWFPVSLMPQLIQKFSKLTLVYWSMEGFDQVLWMDASFRELLPTLGILAAMTAVVMTISVWRFNRSNLFQ